MIIDEYDYKSYHIEIHEDLEYHDWNFIVKQNESIIIDTSKVYFSIEDARNGAELAINLLDE